MAKAVMLTKLMTLMILMTPFWSSHMANGHVIGTFSVANQHQCRRLCWYRKLCAHFSFGHQQSSGLPGNCWLLTANNGLGAPRSEEVNGDDILNGCASRPCGLQEVCVPRPPGHNYRCLPCPSDCGPPTSVSNASISTTGSSPGDVASVTCHPGFVMTPADVPTTMTCLEISTWSEFDGECVHVEFRDGSIPFPFVVPLPWSMSEGWSACMKGVFAGNAGLFVNLLPATDSQPGDLSSYSTTNVILRISLRNIEANHDGKDDTNIVVCSHKEKNMTTVLYKDEGRMPLTTDDPFTLSLAQLNNTLHFTVNGVQFSCGALPAAVNLSAARYVGVTIKGAKTLDYVNTISADSCM